jgi:hypothetical protein
LDDQLKVGIELRIDEVVRGIAGDTLAEIVDLDVRADGERLGVARQTSIVLVFRTGTPVRNWLASWTWV